MNFFSSFHMQTVGFVILASYFFLNLSASAQERGTFFYATNLNLEAKAAYVFDFRTNAILYEKNPESQLPLASLTKIMTALVAQEMLPQNILVQIDDLSLRTEGKKDLRRQERWGLFDLLAFTLIESSNVGASAVAEAFRERNESSKQHEEDPFIAAMNAKARNLRLPQTYFLNETGLDQSQTLAGSYGSARDMVHLLWSAFTAHPSLFSLTAERKASLSSFDEIIHVAQNTNESLNTVPGMIASKTGYTDLAGGNLALLFEPEPMHPIGMVVLGSSKEGRFRDVSLLTAHILRSFGD